MNKKQKEFEKKLIRTFECIIADIASGIVTSYLFSLKEMIGGAVGIVITVLLILLTLSSFKDIFNIWFRKME